MSILDGFAETLSASLEAAKDVPLEKIAAVGLIILGVSAVAAKAMGVKLDDVGKIASDVIDAKIK